MQEHCLWVCLDCMLTWLMNADLNVLQPEQFLLQMPALDWTFGGVFPVTNPEDEDRCQQ